MPQPHATILNGATANHHQSSQAQNFSSYGGADAYPSNSSSTLLASKYSSTSTTPVFNAVKWEAGANTPVAPNPSNPSQASKPPSYYYHYNKGGSSSGRSSSVSRGVGEARGEDIARAAPYRRGSSTTREQRTIGETLFQPPHASASIAEDGAPPPRRAPPRSSSLARGDSEIIVEQSSSFSPRDQSSRARRTHSRSSSNGNFSDGFRNLNRWSASSTSSRASGRPGGSVVAVEQHSQQHASPARRSSRPRRVSVDSITLIGQATEDPKRRSHQSPRKLSKRRPSNSSTVSPRSASNSSARQGRRHSPPPPIPPNLPPIVALPSLEIPAATDSSSFATESPTISRRPSPAINTPSLAITAKGDAVSSSTEPRDYFGGSNMGLPETMQEKAPSLLPAATVIPDKMSEKKGHTRSRSSQAKGSSDSTRVRSKQPSQKAMLSKALAKANTAVQLDNARNYEGARQAYSEACDLLLQVLEKTPGEDDKRKLEAIRQTYTSRIDELDGLLPTQVPAGGKELPARPESIQSSIQSNGVDDNGEDDAAEDDDDDGEEPVIIETATATRIVRDGSPMAMNNAPRFGSSPTLDQAPPQRLLQSSFSRSPMRRNFEETLDVPRANNSNQFMPAPLSPRPLTPRRPTTPPKPASPEDIVRQDFPRTAEQQQPTSSIVKGHMRNESSRESISWLDAIDESGGSTASSVHSRNSSFGVRRKHIRAASGNTEAEFDAALDAAVEAAYDDGYEPFDSNLAYSNMIDNQGLQTERGRERDRESAIQQAREKERSRQAQDAYSGDFFFGSDSEEEEERMLDEITRDYVNDRSSVVPNKERESGSSGSTHRTWHSSMGSNPPTMNTVLSTVTEASPQSKTEPSASMPPPPPPQSQYPSTTPPGVRSRRLPGKDAKQLKIETSKLRESTPVGIMSAQPRVGSYIVQQRQAMSAATVKTMPFSMRAPDSPGRIESPAPGAAPPTPPRHEPPIEEEEPQAVSPGSPRPTLHKNQSYSSFRSLRGRQQSISRLDESSDLSPNTPITTAISGGKLPAVPALPTPVTATFASVKSTGGHGGFYLFDADIPPPEPVTGPLREPEDPNQPVPLEPCPADTLLRPFWLMRALYQTLCHPRGGYVTNRMFVPHDAWKVKGVKLRALEDKSSQCDLLTAALLKLARVDSNDADAVLEEMQSFESVLETVQNNLTRRLGSEVGTTGLQREVEGEPTHAVPRTASVSERKSSAFSWRRLKSKGSAVNLSSAYGAKSTSGGSGGGSNNHAPGERETVGSMTTLPMTPTPCSRPPKRDVTSVNFEGPYAGYLGSLARLFDAAQVVDQIARQVEDPGLKHADKTQVGLELCTRHAAEFFGFYICRFVLADLGLLLDKFVKRGSEWVLS